MTTNKKMVDVAELTPGEKKTIAQMVDASVEYFRKRRAKEKRGPVNAIHVYHAFVEEIGRRIYQIQPGEIERRIEELRRQLNGAALPKRGRSRSAG